MAFSIRALLTNDYKELGLLCKVPGPVRCMLRLSRDASYRVKTCIISMFSLHRLIYFPPSTDVDSITRVYSGSYVRVIQFMYKMRRSARSFIKYNRISLIKPKNLNWFKSSSSGPNGKPGYNYLIEDFRAINKSLSLRVSLLSLYLALPISNREVTQEALLQLQRLARLSKSDESEVHSRLHFLADKAGKTRVIAIGEFLSQSLLKIIHDHLFNILRRHPCDGTFDQDKQRRRVQEATKSSRLCYSLDLRECTDRLPA